jgi:hypothetical protein
MSLIKQNAGVRLLSSLVLVPLGYHGWGGPSEPSEASHCAMPSQVLCGCMHATNLVYDMMINNVWGNAWEHGVPTICVMR